MKNKIKNIVDNNPKHFTRLIKKEKELFDFIENEIKNDNLTLKEKIRVLLYNDEYLCENGNYKKFISINEGFRFCGNPKSCMCSKDVISRKISEKYNSLSEEEKNKIKEKRKITNLEKYGVENTAQTSYAKNNHKEFYKDKNKVHNALEKYKKTCFEKYGVFNTRLVEFIDEKIKQTLLDRYNVTNIQHIPGVSEKAQLTKNKKHGSTSDIMLKTWYTKLKEKFEENNNLEFLCDIENYIGSNGTYKFKCLVCKNVFDDYFHSGNNPICRVCNKKICSTEQQEIVDFLQKELGIEKIIVNDRNMLNGLELDIFLPDYNFAIEYHGVYWHNETYKDNSYHIKKFNMCKDKNIELISIFSSYWKNKKTIIKSLLRNKLKKTTKKIYARNCIIKEVSDIDAKDILESTHIFGYTKSTYKYGLYFDDELVSLMCFNKPRLGIGKNQNGYELTRYTSKYTIVGGASKLLNYFIKQNITKEIYSFSDNCFSNGNLYKKLGFIKQSDIKESYWYVDTTKDKIFHRFNFRKSKLKEMGYDVSTLTEKEIVSSIGLVRIWDCGKQKWILKL